MRLVKNIALEIRKARRNLRRKLIDGIGEVRPMDFSDFTVDLVAKVSPYTLTPPERVFNLELAIRRVVRRRVPGDIVECGVGGKA